MNDMVERVRLALKTAADEDVKLRLSHIMEKAGGAEMAENYLGDYIFDTAGTKC